MKTFRHALSPHDGIEPQLFIALVVHLMFYATIHVSRIYFIVRPGIGYYTLGVAQNWHTPYSLTLTGVAIALFVWSLILPAYNPPGSRSRINNGVHLLLVTCGALNLVFAYSTMAVLTMLDISDFADTELIEAWRRKDRLRLSPAP